MRLRIATAALASLVFVAISCSENSVTGPEQRPSITGNPRYIVDAPIIPTVRISEIHYDNASTDVGEKIEVSGPAGTDLTGWKLVLYNGADTKSYATVALTGTIPATCVGRGVVAVAISGIQNGDPDAVALVDNGGRVIELLSYGGSFTASDGPAAGTVTRNIVVK